LPPNQAGRGERLERVQPSEGARAKRLARNFGKGAGEVGDDAIRGFGESLGFFFAQERSEAAILAGDIERGLAEELQARFLVLHIGRIELLPDCLEA
jgi:hypothetical protein